MNIFDYFFEDKQHLEKDFVLGPKETISFKELYTNSIQFAAYLREHIGTDKNIILICPNSVFFITAYLGILKSENICIPLNYAIEQGNLDYIVKTTDSPIVIAAKSLSSKLTFKKSVRIIKEDVLTKTADFKIGTIFNFNFDPNKIGEIIFTSGSTGKPKGVMISHKNIMANTDSIIQYLKLTSDDIVGVVLPFFYCYGLSLMHTHLKVGGSIVLNNTFIFLGSVIDDLKKYKCTGFAGVPSHFQILLKKSLSFKTSEFPDLRYVTQAGGKLHSIFIKEFIDAFPRIDFFVMYGQTEATARLSYLPPKLLKDKIQSIGKAIPGVSLKVMNNEGKIAKTNEEGELLAKGDNIMLGYYKDEESTLKTIKNGWLHTGDIAKVDADGFIYIVARKKEIIKVGGKRVSPKEIEEVILSLPEVVDCTVSGIPDEILGEAIKVVITTQNKVDQKLMKDKVLNTCAKKLSMFKIPQKFVFDTSIKLNATGKKIVNP
ncbi:AMP-binding protein [Maribacter polysiphoniae]|uniref:AMP-binding protein n=1 Tax=Maribacter polysiphoniae TaxID=429344 RepID=A0A316E5G4_9FLAO|nr:AMP-binding protein [Maribacter polysiphoniae]MBD1260919.1 AMP-binding protein [Maribacter polysiphoniae]PWK23943.1 acyl-CoA synthetase (AMP-forming)/AMP-acid ligase II [Maribacter polysiphoniae]